jgi:ubiquinol-cytochrome c reductase cytochrome b subunit
LTEDQLVRQVIQGSGNMPAYGKNLSPPEVAALVAFMSTLHQPTEAPARDSSRPAQASTENMQPNATTQMASTKP